MDLRLIVGLGNPGRKYQQHRHNIGFLVVDELAKGAGIRLWRRSCKSQTVEAEIGGIPVLLAKPQTFMNRTGEAVALLMGKNKVHIGSVIVVHDDIDLEPGRIKIKKGGGHGGHNGLRSIIEKCTADFFRIRIGIGRPEAGEDPAEYVLMKFSDPAEAREWVKRAADIMEYLLLHGPTEAMNHFHS